VSIADQIHECGWDLDREEFPNENRGTIETCYRASQGHFHTMWRNSPELVLSDVKQLREKQAQNV